VLLGGLKVWWRWTRWPPCHRIAYYRRPPRTNLTTRGQRSDARDAPGRGRTIARHVVHALTFLEEPQTWPSAPRNQQPSVVRRELAPRPACRIGLLSERLGLIARRDLLDGPRPIRGRREEAGADDWAGNQAPVFTLITRTHDQHSSPRGTAPGGRKFAALDLAWRLFCDCKMREAAASARTLQAEPAFLAPPSTAHLGDGEGGFVVSCRKPEPTPPPSGHGVVRPSLSPPSPSPSFPPQASNQPDPPGSIHIDLVSTRLGRALYGTKTPWLHCHSAVPARFLGRSPSTLRPHQPSICRPLARPPAAVVGPPSPKSRRRLWYIGGGGRATRPPPFADVFPVPSGFCPAETRAAQVPLEDHHMSTAR